MASSASSGLIPPHVGPRVREPGGVAELGDMTRRLAPIVWAGKPFEIPGRDRSKRHRREVTRGVLAMMMR